MPPKQKLDIKKTIPVPKFKVGDFVTVDGSCYDGCDDCYDEDGDPMDCNVGVHKIMAVEYCHGHEHHHYSLSGNCGNDADESQLSRHLTAKDLHILRIKDVHK